MLRTLLLSSLLFSSLLPAQQVTVTVPNIPGVVNVDRPFPGGIGRYQQWFSAASLQAAIGEPMRLERLEFFAGLAPTSQAAQIDCEFLMGHGKFSGVTGTFDANWDSPPVVVKPRALVQLNAGATGAVVMTVPLTTLFTWDRVRPVLLEIRVHGNSLGNQPFAYNFRGSTTSTGVTSRVYAAGSPGVTQGTVLQGVGMMTRFTARPGAVLSFGAGCPGEGGFVPVAGVAQLPWPGITWTHTLGSAASQQVCMWLLGDTRDAPFPIDLGVLFGTGANNCFLRTNPVLYDFAVSIGGGAGSGIATYGLFIPATTAFVGVHVFSQWIVLDGLAPAGYSTSNGVWSIVAPVGG